MAVYKIYHKDGSILSDANGKEIEVHSIEYNGTWMGECFVTVTFENEAPIDFSIGDYIVYRNERFEINYDPGKIKCSSKDSYGGAFKYDSVKFNALSDELVRCDMLDLVLYDNNLHYTALPQFTFYVESLDDLLDRIQANLDELYGKASWKLYSRNKQRSIQRGGLESEWNSIYGDGTADNVIDSTSISISDQTCWDALSLVNSQFDVNFIIRNRNVYVGTAGMPTSNIFKYGKDKGLYEIEQNSESDQAIVTRLRAYGSNRNLPNHYYADLGSIPFLNITGDYHDGSTDSGLSVMMEDSVYAGMFTDIISDNGSNTKHCRIRGSIGGYEFDGEVELVKKDSTKSTTRLLVDGKAVCDVIKAKIDAGIVQVDFISGANKAKFNGDRISYVSNLPNNMACDRLMLPGFPNKSLSEWWNEQSEAKKAWLNPGGKGHDFSANRHRPYVDSLNIGNIGIRPASVFFDQDDKVNGIVEIYPTIEEMEVDGVRIDEIYTGTNIEDDGRFGDGETVANVPIYLSPKVNFDIRALMQEDFTIHMKDGMCAGREFKVAGCTKEKNGSWKLMIERNPDSSLGLYFPYNDFQIKKGDHFVLTGIELPDAYVEAASEKLLRYCIAYLDKNDYTRYVYQPKVDEIFMARQHDTAMADASGLTKSLYLTLKEGDIMLFKDDDLGIDAEITIDQLTIKEEDGKIPTYEITLREEKEVGTIQKIQNQISSITNGNGGSFTGGTGGGGLSSSQIKNLIDAIGSDRFLSKLNPDTAKGIITFLQGTNWGNFTSETGAAMSVDPTTGQTYMEVDRLKVRLKAFFEQLEVQKVGYVGGKLVVTPGQGVDILDVEEVYDTDGNLTAYRCYFLGEQEGRKIDNLLRVKDQMICKDFNVSEGTTDGATNKYYWRLATAVSSDVVKRGNYVCHWVDLSATDCDTNSDIPEIGDTICHLGNREDTDRQGAEILSVVDANSPSFTIYSGINSYSLVNKEYIDMGVAGGKAFCNIYGSTYIGDRNRENGYISWDYDKEENVWKMRVKGTIDITSQLSSGGTIGGAIDDAANAYKGDFSTFTSNVNEIIGGFQAQIDGVIETWFYDPEPTLGNLPASEWKDNTTKDKHLGDLYYSKSGLAYRFQKEGDIYKWVQIDDTAITSALKEAKAAKDAAAAAQGTANSKMRVFVVQPTDDDEYSVGDMWVNATYPADGSTYNNEILHCVTKKAAGEAFSISHWAQSSNIKTQFNNFVNNTYAEDKKDFYNQLDGKVETWYQKDDPKDKWAAADYSKHKGDIWYNDTTNKSYRWTGTAWVELKDQAAIDAKTLAESKKRVFTTTALPTPPYDKKDLWVQGENGDIMVCVTPKAAGTTASASDWEKASKYTDDTAAKAAQKTANDAATAAQEINASITAIDGNVDVALKDKIITKTEAAAIKEALKGLEAIMADVNKTKKELEDNAVYKSIADDVKTDYSDAYKALSAAFTALSDYINNTLLVANPITDEILSSYTYKYSNFKTKYEDYVSELTVVRNSMDALLNTRIGDIATMLGGLTATTDAMNESTQINGGLILSSLLALGYTNNSIFNVMSGVSGLYESGETGGGIAFWAGGHRIDINNCTKNADGTYSIGGKVVNPADFLVRHDGTGYAAGGKMWWDENGKIHADPQSFLINEEYVGNVMQLFKFEYSGGTEFTNIVHAIPQKPFESLSVGANGLTLYNGDKSAKFYVKDGVLFLEGDLAVTGGITMYASNGVTSGLLDQVYAIMDSSKFEIKNGVITIKGDIGDGKVKGATLGGVAVTLNNGILEFDAYPTTLPASDVYAWAKAATKPTYSWGEITEKPSSFTPSAHTHDDRYYTESEIDTKLGLKLDTSLKGAADGLATLDSSGKVPSSQLPSYVDDVLEYANKASFPNTGESGKIYIDKATNLTYRWGGTAYVEISQSLALGETSSTAYAGDKGKKNADNIAALQTGKADKATTLSGYGITDAYTKTEVNTKLTDGSVTKIGTKDVGSATLPIYLKAGVPTAVGTSLAVDITGNSATATKLKTSITLWGQSFNGSANVSGDMTGVGTITPTGEDLKVVGNLIVTGGIVMYADDGATIESGFAALLAAHIDGVTIKYNEAQQKIYSVMTGIKVNGTTYKPSETDGYITIPDYPTSLDWENIENKPSSFTPSSHTHTFASLTSKPTTLSGYGITDAKIVNGVITLGTATITPLTAHQTVTLASGTNNGTLKLTVNGTATDNIAVKGLGSAAFTASSAYAAASHTHSQYLVASSLDGYVNALTDNTSTNVFVTAISKSGKTLSYTKSFTKKSLTAASHSGWSSADTDKLIIPDMSFIAYWNGAYNSDGKSNLTYCNKGAFGDMATAAKSSYYTKTEVNTKLTDGSVTKLGTATVGSGTQHFYLNAGTATASTSTVGGTAKPMYLNAGVMTAISATVGGTAKPIFLNAGTLTAISATVGSASKPVYLSGGSVTACSYDFTSYLPLSGGTMGGTAWIVWPDSGNWGNNNSGVTFPVTRGGLHWVGQSDWVKLYSQETGSDNLNLVLQFGDDNSNGLSIRNNGGSQTAFISATGHISAANGTVNGTLKVGAIPVTNSSTGVLKIDGNLIVTGGITMYATDGVASGLMEQILVDGTTIGKKADGTLYAINTGNVRSIVMGSTTYTPNDSGAVTLPEKVTWANIEGKPSTFAPSSHTHTISQITNLQATLDGKAAASHTHSYLPLAGGTLTGALTIDFNHSGGGTTSSLLNVLFNGTHDFGVVAKFHSYGGDSPAIRFSHSSNKSEYNSQVNTNWSVGMRASTYTDFAITQDRGTSGWGTVRFAINNSGNVGIGVDSASYKLHVAGDIYTTTGFKKNGSSDSYVLLGGGGHKLISDFATSGHTHSYLPLSGGTLTGDLYINKNLYGPVVGNNPRNRYDSGLHFFNSNSSTTSIYNFGLYQWNDEFQFTYRTSADDLWKGNSFTIQGSDGQVAFVKTPKVGSTLVSLAGHTHSYLPLSGGTMTGYIFAPEKGIIFYGSVGATTGAYLVGSSEGVYINGYKYVTLESSSVNYHPRVRLNTVDYPLLSTYNYNSYVPTLTGTGASGTWGISISGNAAMATNADTVDGYHASAFALSGHTHSYLPLSGGTISGRLLVNYNVGSSTPAIAINFYDNYTIVDNSIAQIKMGTPKYDAYLGLSPAAKGYYGKVGYFMHIGTDYEFLWATSNWTKRMALECSSGNLWVAGSVTASSFVGNASSATKLTSSAGSATLPIYFSDGKPVACTASSVFSNLSNSGNNISVTVAGQNRTLTVGYATNADKVDGYHATDGRTFNGNINWSQNWSDLWSDGTNQHPWYGFDHRYSNTGAYSTTITDYFGMTIKTANTLRLDFNTLLLNGTSIYNINVASSSKWQTARKITLTGSVTGSVSIDGSGDVTLATTTNHTHSYLPLAGGTMTGQIQRAGQGSSWIKGRDNAMIRVNSKNGYSVLSSIKTTNGSWEIGHYDASGYNNNLLFGYYTDDDYSANNNNGRIKVQFTSDGHITAAQFNGALNGNAVTASAVKDLSNSRNSYLNYGESGVTSPSWLCAWNTRSDNTYEIRAISPANVLSVIKALPLAGGTMTAGARISHADGNLYLGRADNNGWLLCQDMCSHTASGDSYWSLRANGTLHALTTYIGGHLWLNKQNASSSTGGASQLVFGLDGTQHVVISSNTGAVIINPSTSSSTGQLILRTGTSSTSEFAGNIKAGGGITMYSDLRKKNILSDEVLSVKEIAAAPLFRHTYKSDDNQYIHVGTSAQYWSGIHEDWFTRKDGEGYYQMELQNLGVAMGISLAREIVTFEGAFKKYESKTDKKIRLMRKKINDLEARIKELEERRTA